MVDRTTRTAFQPAKVSWNLAWIKRGGHQFEIVIDPDAALAYRNARGTTDIVPVLHSEHIFAHAQKGERANEADMLAAFGTADPLAVARILLLEGELQLTAEYRAGLREAARARIIQRIVAYAIDPTTRLPHPRARILLAIEEADIRIDEREDEEKQVTAIVRKLQPILPIKLETVTIQFRLPHPYGQKLYGDLERAGTLKRTEWATDGALIAWVELPAGLSTDLISDISKKSHGVAEVHIDNGR